MDNKALVYLAENPILETERLLLRPMTMDDLLDYHEYTSDGELLKYDYPEHQSIEESRESLVLYNLSAPLGRYGIELKSEGKLIGNISLRIDTEQETAEIGFTVNADYHRKGYATEAALALKELAQNMPGVKIFLAHTTKPNLASQGVLEKIGMTLMWEKEGLSLRREPTIRLRYESQLKNDAKKA